MIRLFLARHAKSSWSEAGLSDHDRILNERGSRDLVRMSEQACLRGWIPDIIISSTAARARITAEGFAEKLLGDRQLISTHKCLYLCQAEDINVFLAGLSNKEKRIMLIGHNPGITAYFNAYTNVNIDNVPTCGIGSFYIEESSWASVKNEKWRNDGFIYPKM